MKHLRFIALAAGLCLFTVENKAADPGFYPNDATIDFLDGGSIFFGYDNFSDFRDRKSVV